MEQDELARRAQVSVVTIRRLEAPDGLSRVARETLDGVRHVLEDAVAEFVGGGVRPRRPPEEVAERIRIIDELVTRSAERRAHLKERWTEDDLYGEDGLRG